jgi:dihydroorotase
MILLIHCEVPPSATANFLNQESEFLPFLKMLRQELPELKIVVEHVTSTPMIRYVTAQDPTRTGATITPPHLVLTMNDIIGPRLFGDHFCRPPAKTPDDRQHLLKYVLEASKYKNIFLGTDSAAHPWWAKHVRDCCAGIFSDLCGLETLVEVFEQFNVLGNPGDIEAFASLNGPAFYGLPLPEESDTVTLVKEPWIVPRYISEPYDGVLELTHDGQVIRRVLIKGEAIGGKKPSAEVALAVNCFRGGEEIPWRVAA